MIGFIKSGVEFFEQLLRSNNRTMYVPFVSMKVFRYHHLNYFILGKMERRKQVKIGRNSSKKRAERTKKD